MASNHTQTYGLNQWALSDSVIMADFNEDNLKTEQALLALKEELKGADQKIEQTLTAALPKFALGSYVGTGTYGAGNPNSLTFAFEPKLLIVAPEPVGTNNQKDMSTAETMSPLVAIRGASTATVSLDTNRYGANFLTIILNLIWNGKTVSWYTNDAALAQYNDATLTYRSLAIG